ncbi:3'-5' exoribonuclease 1-like, partial [Centruroides sculpturatus]|uniref:3'-5' exoribonuclease 1-like n=2 Tax=Centruroides sculpturatus TaxID=218467 RepID=UPI000C6CCC03
FTVSFFNLRKQISNILCVFRGKNDVLRKRLRTFYKEQKTLLNKVNKSNCPYKYLCVIDFEATCDENSNKDVNYPHEIIEFPAVLIETSSKTIVSEFREYCRPVLNKNLTEFCMSLTGIMQDVVDKADTFPFVLERFMTWMASYKLGCGNSFAIVTDGPWDMNKFLVVQCDLSHTSFPKFGKKWVNICKTFANFYKTKKRSLKKMLQTLDMEFEGRKHCGLDDARNIARIVIHLLEKGATVTVNERLSWNEISSRVISASGGFGHKD